MFFSFSFLLTIVHISFDLCLNYRSVHTDLISKLSDSFIFSSFSHLHQLYLSKAQVTFVLLLSSRTFQLFPCYLENNTQTLSLALEVLQLLASPFMLCQIGFVERETPSPNSSLTTFLIALKILIRLGWIPPFRRNPSSVPHI